MGKTVKYIGVYPDEVPNCAIIKETKTVCNTEYVEYLLEDIENKKQMWLGSWFVNRIYAPIHIFKRV